MMRKLEAINFLEARLADIDREHYDELASEDTRSEADARAEAKALAAVYDFLKDCKISHRPAAKGRAQVGRQPELTHRNSGNTSAQKDSPPNQRARWGDGALHSSAVLASWSR